MSYKSIGKKAGEYLLDNEPSHSIWSCIFTKCLHYLNQSPQRSKNPFHLWESMLQAKTDREAKAS